MEKRAILAVILSLLVLLGYQYLFVSEVPKAVDQKSLPQMPNKDSDVLIDSVKKTVSAKASAAISGTSQPDLQGRDVAIETDTIRAVIDTRGASIKSWSLKTYKDKVKGGNPVELVPAGTEQLITLDEENKVSEKLLFTPDREFVKGNGSILFSAVRPDGVVIEKRYTFPKDGYKAQVRTSYNNTSSSAIIIKPAVELSMRSMAADRKVLNHELAYLSGKNLTRITADKLKDEKAGSGKMDWVFFGDKYFITAILPKEGVDTEVYSAKIGEDLFKTKLVFQPLQIKPGESMGDEYEIYFGPKEVDILKTAGSKLERTIDLGFFDLVAYPMLLTFKWMYKVIPNYGIVIILLTIIIKIVFWPLSQKSYKSMKDMQRVAPLMEQLREKYKDDKEKLNREVIELYKRHKVNPLGGCLPMILQIPVFFALYAVLNSAVELRHAPFILWIMDLSAKDPYYVTPILMGATMFVQQKMTPSSGEPAQQKIMMLMPVIFTFMFLNFSSGLVLYWLINNVLSIGQQHYVNKYMK